MSFDRKCQVALSESISEALSESINESGDHRCNLDGHPYLLKYGKASDGGRIVWRCHKHANLSPHNSRLMSDEEYVAYSIHEE